MHWIIHLDLLAPNTEFQASECSHAGCGQTLAHEGACSSYCTTIIVWVEFYVSYMHLRHARRFYIVHSARAIKFSDLISSFGQRRG